MLYHRVNHGAADPWDLCVSPSNFAEQMEVVSRRSPRPYVTFDDGYADNLFAALPVLERYEVAARFFVISGAVGSRKEMWWDAVEQLSLREGERAGTKPDPRIYFELFERLRPLPFAAQEEQLDTLFESCELSREARPERRMLTAEELSKLAASPLAEIGAHTVTHPVLSTLALPAQEREIVNSKLALEEWIGKPVEKFAYPNGCAADYTADTVNAVRRAGFQYAYSAFEHERQDRFQLPRVMIRNWDGDRFACELQEAAARAVGAL